MKLIILMLTVTVFFNGFAYGQCETEKKEADRLNNILKKKVTEWVRDRHRDAKQEFLDCLREPDDKPKNKISTDKKQQKNTRIKAYKPTKSRHSVSSHKKTSHVTVTDYTNFKGKKKLAWNDYFQESGMCMSSHQDMQIFVACAKIRKQNLKAFNARWAHKTQELRPLLDPN